MKVYFDMDGLLADFQGHLLNHHPQLQGVDLWQIPDDKFWPLVQSIPNFWENLPVMPRAIELWDYCYNNFDEVAILSAPSTHDLRSEDGKNKWLDKHLPKSKYKYERYFTKKKEQYADQDSLLIDDMLENCKKFVSKGGKAIYHTDINVTLSIIKGMK
jgi:hypothetical protein